MHRKIYPRALLINKKKHMKDATYTIGTMPFPCWSKNNSDIDRITITGSGNRKDIEDLANEFVYTQYKEIVIDNISIEPTTWESGKIVSFETAIHTDVSEFESILPTLFKLIFNSNGTTTFSVVKGNIYSQDGKTLIHTPECKELFIDSTIEHIGNYCCSNYATLTKLTLSEGLKSIGKLAFSSCEITELFLPDSVISIGQESFLMTEIETVKLSKNLQSLPDGCFSYTAINTIDIPTSVRSIGDEAFHCVPYLECVKIPEGVESIGYDAFCNPTVVYLPSTLKEIAPDFYYEEIVDDGDKPPYIKMHPDNPIFYSEEGSLYYKASGKLALDSKYNGLDEGSYKPPCIP